jgi:GAF domain-containing protein
MPDSTLDDPQQVIADLKRQLAETQRELADAQQTLREVIAERDETLEQQTATNEILDSISSSSFGLQPILEAVLENAIRLSGATRGHIFTVEGDFLNFETASGAWPGFEEYLEANPIHIGHGSIAGRAAAERQIIHIRDVLAEAGYEHTELIRQQGFRTALGVPLLRGGKLLGVIAILKSRVDPFTQKQIDLVSAFAAQAVIAMENARLLDELRSRTNDLQIALDYQTATSDVLKAISRAVFDLDAVLRTMVSTALRLCRAEYGVIFRNDGDEYRFAAGFGNSPEYEERERTSVIRPGRGTIVGRAALEGRAVQILDAMTDPEYEAKDDARINGAHTMLGVPLLREGQVIGAFGLARGRIEPFSERDVQLISTFADQAAVAMENARLLGDLRERTRELEESLEYQTATSDVLQVISRSTFDLQPVLDTVVETATRLCLADQAVIFRREADDAYTLAANFGFPPEYEAFHRKRGRIPAAQRVGSPATLARAAHERAVIHYDDVAAVEGYPETSITLGKQRTALGVPLLREGEPIGVLALARQRVEPFSERQIELVRTFADQAVIAIENTRLLTELRESLEQQQAMAEVLQVINRSPGDLAPVFDAMLEKATSLCGSDFGILWSFENGLARAGALHQVPPAYAELVRNPFRPSPESGPARMMRGEDAIVIPDLKEFPPYRAGDPLVRAIVDLAGARSIMIAPLRRNAAVLGAITLYRREPLPFTDKQIALLRNFAAQAVIATENARLITETREALEQQTATAEVLQVINSSPGDLVPVFEAMLDRAMHLCAATVGMMWSFDGNSARLGASRNVPPAFSDYLERHPPSTGPETFFGRAIAAREVIHTADMRAAEPYLQGVPLARAGVELAGIRALLMAPLVKDDAVLGVFAVFRSEPRPFTDKQIALLQNFAAQAVIAMENARLITETRAAKDDAEAAYRDLKAAQANLIQSEKMASLGQLTAGIAHEIKNPLNFVNNFASLSVELLDELKETAAPALATLDEDRRADLDDTMAMLTGNLEKIAEHGRRADNIVKSMLEHSRGVSGERREVDLNGLVEEALNLAYHGARAQDQSFNITLERDYSPALAPIELAPQEMTRVFLNLFGNGFYAANKRARDGGDRSFRPTLAVATRDEGGAIAVKVRDNGIGIPPEIRDKLFQPFFTTKPTGEGTGLGLSISYDIVTQQHGGTIIVDSEPGAFTEFTIRLPRRH